MAGFGGGLTGGVKPQGSTPPGSVAGRQVGLPMAPPPAAPAAQNPVAQALAQMPVQAPAAAPPTTNTAEANPISNGVINRMLERTDGDMGASRALDSGIQDIRARAALGIGRANELNQVASGTSNSSIVGSDSQDLARQQGAQVNKLTNDITVQRERDRDGLLQAAGNMGLAQGAQQLQALSGAREQNRMDQTAAYEARNAQMQNFNTVLGLLTRKNGVLN